MVITNHILHVVNTVYCVSILPSSKYLAKSSGEVVTVAAHEVVSVPAVFLPQLLQDLLHLVLCEVRVAEVEGLLVPELRGKYTC